MQKLIEYGTESEAAAHLHLAISYTYTEGAYNAVIHLGFWIHYGFP